MKEKDNKLFWQRFARVYGPIMEKSSRKLYQDICGAIGPRLNQNMDVLELACGTGQLSYPLSGRVRLWEATDFSEAMVKEARKKRNFSRLHFSVQDATRLPYAPESFDAVVISNALHIMPHPEKALTEIRRVLKPGGILFAPTFVHGEAGGFPWKVKLMELAGFCAYHKWTAEELTAFLSEHDFCIVKAERMGNGMAPVCYIEAQKSGLDEEACL